jgi:hypothetical protein
LLEKLVWKSTNQSGIQCGNSEIKEEFKEEIKVDLTNQRGIQESTNQSGISKNLQIN